MKFNLNKFKKVGGDDKHTVMQHPDGHTIKIAHSAISPQMRNELGSLPHFAFGTGPVHNSTESLRGMEVGRPDAKPSNYVPVERKENYKTDEEYHQESKAKQSQPKQAAPEKEQAPAPVVEPAAKADPSSNGASYPATESKGGAIKNYDDGGDVNSSSMPGPDSPEQIAADASQNPIQPGIDPEILKRQDAYNQIISSNPRARVDNSRGQPFVDGKAPDSFDPGIAAQADQQVQDQNAASQASQQANNAKSQVDDATRAKFGLPPSSPAPQDNVPASGGPAPASVQAPQQVPVDKPDRQVSDTQNMLKAFQMAQTHVQVVSDEALKTMIEPKLTADGKPNPKAGQWKTEETPTMGKIFAEKSTLGKLGMITGLILGGGASAALGQPNAVAKMYENVIDSEIKEQQMQIGKKNSLLQYNLGMVGHMGDAIALTKAQLMDAQIHQLVQQASKYPNDPKIQQNLQMAAMMGAKSSSNLKDNVAMGTSYRLAADHMGPLGKIQFNPMLSPEQKNAAVKEYGEYENMNALRTDTLSAFDQVAKLNTPSQRLNPVTAMDSYQTIQKLRNITLDKLTKDTSGRVTPETVSLVGSVFKNMLDGKMATNVGRAQLAKILSQNMHFPHLQLAGIDTNTPSIGIQQGPPKLGK